VTILTKPRRKTLQSTQLKFYKVVAVPLLTYESENLITNQSEKKETDLAEMRFLRPVA
jgi:hypothetical protein